MDDDAGGSQLMTRRNDPMGRKVSIHNGLDFGQEGPSADGYIRICFEFCGAGGILMKDMINLAK